jgi:hypothetical protein
MPERYTLSLEKSKKNIQTADHLAYITFPIVKENKLLTKILEEIYLSIINAVNSVLQYEYIYKRVILYNDPNKNFDTFKRTSLKYNISEEQMKKIIDIISLYEKHKKSSFEFARQDKIVILSDNLKTETLTIEKIKSYILETKDMIRKISLMIK